MNIHPIVVHFPIALLTVYSLFELVRFARVREKLSWFEIKAVLVILGTLGALLAWLTGPEIVGSRLNEMHGLFGTFTLVVFSIIALAYALQWKWPFNPYSNFVLKSSVIVTLSLLGLALVTITGGLGGAMVYDTHLDPLMAPIFKILGVY